MTEVTIKGHQKIVISLLSDAKLQKNYDWFLGLIIYVKYLRSYLQKNMKGGSEKSEILCVGQLACAEKKRENSNFNRRPLHRANISQMFLWAIYCSGSAILAWFTLVLFFPVLFGWYLVCLFIYLGYFWPITPTVEHICSLLREWTWPCSNYFLDAKLFLAPSSRKRTF